MIDTTIDIEEEYNYIVAKMVYIFRKTYSNH